MAQLMPLIDLMSIGERISTAGQYYEAGPLADENKEYVVKTYQQMAEYCDTVGVPEISSLLRKQTEAPEGIGLHNLLVDAFASAIDQQIVVVLSKSSREFYQPADLFGPDVSAAFPSSVPEIRDGSTCFALGQPTAAVFHFLRALEPPIKALGAEFGITKFTDWNSALNDIEDAVRDRSNPQTRPNWADEKDDYTEMVTHLFLVKNAWRNYTMHLKLRHTDEEAREVMAAAKSFMRRAAKRVKE